MNETEQHEYCNGVVLHKYIITVSSNTIQVLLVEHLLYHSML